MSLSRITRFLNLSLTTTTQKIPALHFSTSSLANEIYSYLQNNPKNTERVLNSIKPKLDATCVNEVLERCSLGNSQMGLRFFVWAGCQSSYRHSSYMYSKACDLFKIRENPQVVLDLMEGYRLEKCVVSVKAFKVVLSLCKEGRLANEALLVLKKMPEFHVCADTGAYNAAIELFSDSGDMDTAKKLLEEMGLIELYPNMVTYISMIKGFCDVGRLEEACELLKAMRAQGCMPNLVAYSTLLAGFCRFGSIDKAMELLEQMEKEGGECSPSVITYTCVIQSLCDRGMTMDALAILDRMDASGCPPNRVTVSTLIKGLCVDGQVEEAYKLVDRVAGRGSVSYGECYSSLLLCLMSIKKIEEAEKLFKRVLASGVRPDGLSCSVMIRKLCSEERMLDAFYLYNEIEKMGSISTIDSDIYSILLGGLCEEGHSVEAEKLARIMLEKRICLQGQYADIIVASLRSLGNTELITKLVGIQR
ncbi:hypothetical protein Tsubulata_040911 [Turnera subulata]|uniref:Pentacotripeptide-repeat region of PRORP domain-containing protein n=1 Tax=Turnera subulata TaxID=218843 RepID=A0A9Q0GGA1_9ROSI|nr:hypothetical protein Tsubulata_040911 [Turnera subulata]